MGDRARPLAGRTVLVTRPARRGGKLARRLEALGAVVEVRPTIALETPSDPAPARRAVRRLGEFDWIVFTSANGVRFFLARLREAGSRVADVRARIASLGPATGAVLEESGLKPARTAEQPTAEGLAATLRDAVEGRRVLVVGPEVSRPVLADALRDAGAEIEAVAFYRNVAAEGVDDVAERVCRGCYDVVVFTSPSTLHRLIEGGWSPRSQVLRALGDADLVAIGAVTAQAIVELGLRVSATAATPSDDGIVRAVCALYDGGG